MKHWRVKRLFMPAGLGLAVLAASYAMAQQGDLLDVRQAMREGINAATMEIWDVGNNAMDDAGGLDPAQMTPQGWARLESAARNLQEAAQAMHDAGTIIAAAPDNLPEEGEPGAVSMADVQRYIDADPDGFRAAALALADHAGLLADAARSREAQAAGDLIAQLDQVCEACHARFWYPEQNVLARR